MIYAAQEQARKHHREILNRNKRTRTVQCHKPQVISTQEQARKHHREI